MPRRIAVLACLLFIVGVSFAHAEKFAIKDQHDGGKTVLVDGTLFTEYWVNLGAKPILWPIVGPGGQEMSRNYPMKRVDGEKFDHPHQRSLWFTFGDINGVDFWSEFKEHGSTRHREYILAEATNDYAVIATRNDWLDHGGKKLLEDERRLTFRVDDQSRIIDFEITLMATAGPVIFGDNKEGAMGIRVPTSMDVDPEKNQKRKPGEGGHIVNAEGIMDKDAWGKRSPWVDYYGPVEGETVGVAVMSHPSSFRHPTPWHVRTYGLFAANPFGSKVFDPQAADGKFELKPGESLTLRYRFVFHKGDAKQAEIAKAYERYAAEKK